MNRFEACPLIENMQMLATQHMYLVVASAKQGGGDINKARESAVKLAERSKALCAFAGLMDSVSKIDTSLMWMSGSVLGLEALGTELRNVSDTILAEAKKHRFLRVLPEHSTYVDHPHLFGESVTSAFPDAAEDIREAGNCLAADCNTASVFHLMRAVEWGLRALCVHLGFKKAKAKVKKSGKIIYAPIEYTEWEKLLDGLQDKVDQKLQRLKRSPDKQKLQEFYYPALQDIRGLRDAWRNHVMHTRSQYSAKDAEAVLDHVKRLMVTLSKHLSEV